LSQLTTSLRVVHEARAQPDHPLGMALDQYRERASQAGGGQRHQLIVAA
jgi:hypothetical protein